MSSPAVSREILQQIEDKVYDIISSMEDELVEQMINSNGLAYGDIDLPTEESILKFMDDRAQGVHEELRTMKPEELQKREREFVRDAEQGGVI